MSKQTSLEVTINVVIHHAADIDILDFNVQPLEQFRAMSPQDRVALWSKLRDEIDEFWLSAALESDQDATWNYWLEDIDLD